MANISDFKKGTTINGPVSYIIKKKLNGQIVYDPAIAPATISCLVNYNDETKCVVSGSFCSVNNINGVNQIVLPDATKKGADIEYVIASKEIGAYKCYSKLNSEVEFYQYFDGTKISAMKLLPGMKFWLQATEDLVVGDKATIDTTNEYQIKKATSGDTAFLLVEQGCATNGLALVVVVQKEVIA